MKFANIEYVTSHILQQLNISKLPIPIEDIATKRGLQIKPFDLGEDVSGVLMIDNGKGTIGYNPTESKVRQRFTVAHELGHYELHKGEKELFVDNFRVEFRNSKSSTGEILKEQQANAFAAAILMPEKLLRKEIQSRKFDLAEEGTIKELSKVFNVSTTAMAFRIANLNLFQQITFKK
ncbi:MAG TPA: ImmA/IrrE family metallo-endopeptidase [Chitinophagales bacterium]|nr:ImmA/IrrE family metallo-endopeptidase [Chitinophagales bacterium]